MNLWKPIISALTAAGIAATLTSCGHSADTGENKTSAGASNAVQVSDVVGRTVSFDKQPERIILGEGRGVFASAIIDREHPVNKVVGMGEDLKSGAPSYHEKLMETHPEARDIKTIGSLSKADVSVENLISLRPDVILMSKDHFDAAKDTGLTTKLDQAGLKYLVTDFRQQPLTNTTKSMEVYGAVFGKPEKAQEFNKEWRTRIDAISSKTAQAEKKDVFVWRAGGYADCCASVKDGNIGEFVNAAGGKNIGDRVMDAKFGTLTPEKLIELQPENVLITGGSWAKKGEQKVDHVTLGYTADPAQAERTLAEITKVAGMDKVSALSNGHSAAIWHQFYDSPLNYLAVEMIAKWLHPELFKDLDPEADWKSAHDKYVPFPATGEFFVSAK